MSTACSLCKEKGFRKVHPLIIYSFQFTNEYLLVEPQLGRAYIEPFPLLIFYSVTQP